MNVDMDTDDWLGCPTPLEMYKHQCALLEDELIQTGAMLRKARANIAGLVQMNDLLVTWKKEADARLIRYAEEASALNHANSEMGRKINSLMIVSSQRDHLSRENQRLLLELKVLKGPSD
ncbi:hypothetical protein [Pseudomonas cedrina]|uniref:hypothetical protein n=1 Tax=Pseudomonas cedrina TaxID=651740 RepID=UPI0027842446|nr:hypothetical protein [Pseudomonas cedrina]MDQ0654370.1 hypothetical protein [Pseudomonas cedrina]